MSGKGELTKEQRDDGLRRLANRLGCPSPAWISDAFFSLVMDEPSLSPTLLEKWLVKTNKYNTEKRDESIEECMTRVYGKEWATLAKSLI